jgi:phytoene synthase
MAIAVHPSATTMPSLEQAYEACRLETAQWAKTFYLGTLLMPPAKRRAIWAIYVWCRRTDELMDSAEAQQRSTDELAARLDVWEQRTRDLFAGKVCDGLDRVMADTLERYPQPIQPYLDMIEGQRMDLFNHRYASFAELEL